MSGAEQEFTSKMEAADVTEVSSELQAVQQQQAPVSFLEASHNMRDFWGLNKCTATSNHAADGIHMGESSGECGARGVTDVHYEKDQYPSYRNGSGVGHHVSEPDAARVQEQQPVQSSVIYYTNLCHPAYPAPAVDATYRTPYPSSSPYISAHATYTNFFNSPAGSSTVNVHNTARTDQPQMPISTEGRYKWNVAPAIPLPSNGATASCTPFGSYSAGSVMSSTSITTLRGSGENPNRDVENLRQELSFKCPRSSNLITAITTIAQDTVQKHGHSSTSVNNEDNEDDDDDDDEDDEDDEEDADVDEDDTHIPQLFPLSQQEQADLELRSAIVEHPFYPEMVVAHIRVFKIGAPKALRKKLDNLVKKFQRFQLARDVTRIGDDPSLDSLMRSYVDLLVKLAEDMEEPFNEFMKFKDATTKQLEEICGHYVETAPDETDNYGYEISAGGLENELEERMKEEQNLQNMMRYPYNDVDESIIIDASLPDDEIRKKLMQKYGRHIGGLKEEFNRARKKGKLPTQARNVLKDWFNRHSYWPYPSEAEKQYLQRNCSLNLKQINNWFINERKRHWSCEGKCMHPNAKFYNNAKGHRGGKNHQEE